MAEKIILTADLYDNAVTERKGDYTAKPRITGTVRNHQIAERILARGSEFDWIQSSISWAWAIRKR